MINMDLQRPIPEISFPSIASLVKQDCGEALVDLRKEGILCDSQYFRNGIPGAFHECYARESVAKMLLEAEKLLPNKLRIKVWDGYRPICVQKRLWNYYRQDVIAKAAKEGEELSAEQIDKRTSFFVSKPSEDVSMPSLHNTGGAVDVTLVTKEGYALDMGTPFDDFTDRAWTNHFEPNYENHEENEDVCKNRRILYNAMMEAGFTNLPSEWWHYDYGDKFWAYFKGRNPIYQGILEFEGDGNRFPLF